MIRPLSDISSPTVVVTSSIVIAFRPGAAMFAASALSMGATDSDARAVRLLSAAAEDRLLSAAAEDRLLSGAAEDRLLSAAAWTPPRFRAVVVAALTLGAPLVGPAEGAGLLGALPSGPAPVGARTGVFLFPTSVVVGRALDARVDGLVVVERERVVAPPGLVPATGLVSLAGVFAAAASRSLVVLTSEAAGVAVGAVPAAEA